MCAWSATDVFLVCTIFEKLIRAVPDLLLGNPAGAGCCRIYKENPAGAGAGFHHKISHQ